MCIYFLEFSVTREVLMHKSLEYGKVNRNGSNPGIQYARQETKYTDPETFDGKFLDTRRRERWRRQSLDIKRISVASLGWIFDK